MSSEVSTQIPSKLNSLEVPLMQLRALSQLCQAPQSCCSPIPHSPRTPQAVPTSVWEPEQLWHPKREQSQAKILLWPQNVPSGAGQ